MEILTEVWALMRDKNKNEYFLITYKFIFNDDWTYDFISLSKQVLTGAAYPGLYNATAMIPGNKAEVIKFLAHLFRDEVKCFVERQCGVEL